MIPSWARKMVVRVSVLAIACVVILGGVLLATSTGVLSGSPEEQQPSGKDVKKTNVVQVEKAPVTPAKPEQKPSASPASAVAPPKPRAEPAKTEQKDAPKIISLIEAITLVENGGK